MSGIDGRIARHPGALIFHTPPAAAFLEPAAMFRRKDRIVPSTRSIDAALCISLYSSEYAALPSDNSKESPVRFYPAIAVAIANLSFN